MKRSNEDLRKRGYITEEDIKLYNEYHNSRLMEMINDKEAVFRSVSINILSNRINSEDSSFIDLLLNRLVIEKCLYTKIKICSSLEKGKSIAAEKMVNYLGKIGNNQYKAVPLKVSKKKSYPLPRDIIARTLGKMEPEVLPVLFDVLNSNDEGKISKVLDAIGFLLFYNGKFADDVYFGEIINTINRFKDNDLIVWKCLCCLSAFKNKECIVFLQKFIDECNNECLINQAERSLNLLNIAE